MSQYRYYLNGTLVNEAEGWERLVTTIKRNRSTRGIEVTQDATITFNGAAYDTLYGYKQTQGFDYTIDLLIRSSEDGGNTWLDWHEGTIFLSDIEWDEEQNRATTKVVDRGYFARINNNKKLKIPLFAEFSKNNTAITPCPVKDLKLFEPSSGTYYTITQPVGGEYSFSCYKVVDAMEFMLRWMTDGAVGFESDTLADTGDYPYYVITTGRVLQNGDPNIVYSPPITYPGVSEDQWRKSWDSVTFEDALSNLCKRFNLWWSVVMTSGGLVFKLEREEYWRDTTNLLTMTGLNKLKCRTNSDLLYGAVSFGQGETDEDTYLSFPETIEFIGFKDEELPVVGESNVADNTLDLKTTWVSSSNVIEAMLVNGLEVDRDFDNKVFILECENDSGAMKAVATNNLDGSSVRYYNQTLTNSEIAKRFLGAVPNSLALYLGTDTGYFVARKTSIDSAATVGGNVTSIIGSNITFDNDYDSLTYEDPVISVGAIISQSSDPDGVYGGAIVQGNPVNNANSYFTAPASGRFGVSAGIIFNFIPGDYLVYSRYDIVAWVTDNIGNFLYYVPIASINPVNGFNVLSGSAYLNLTSGERVYVYRYYVQQYNQQVPILNWTPTSYQVFNNGFFACTSVQTGGGIYQQYDPTHIPIYNYEMEYPVTESEFNTILQSKRGTLTFSRSGGKVRSGWIESFKYNHKKNQANIILASKQP